MRHLLSAVFLTLLSSTATAQNYDLVITEARVGDPETALDQVRNIGVIGVEIADVTPEPIPGSVEIDATGLIAAPGFYRPARPSTGSLQRKSINL